MKRYRVTGSVERTIVYTYDCVVEAKDAEKARAIVLTDPDSHNGYEESDDDDYHLKVELDEDPQPEPEA